MAGYFAFRYAPSYRLLPGACSLNRAVWCSHTNIAVDEIRREGQ